MFWRKKKRAPEQDLSFPSTTLPECDITETVIYSDVAKSIGFAPAELVHRQLIAACRKKNIQIYNYLQMSAFLTQQRKRVGAAAWAWRPLRKKDALDYGWGNSYQGSVDGFYQPNWNRTCGPYDMLVPRRVLERTASMAIEMGDRVKFLVSDFTEHPAPAYSGHFIMAMPASYNGTDFEGYHVVFDSWGFPH